MIPAVDRLTHTILDWELTTERSVECLQARVDRLPQARRYYADGLEAYQEVVYAPGVHTVSIGKQDMDTVEGCHADVRHDIAVLARKTRAVTRSEASLRDTIRLFVAAYNRRQLHHVRFPHYRRAIGDFLSP